MHKINVNSLPDYVVKILRENTAKNLRAYAKARMP